LEVYGILDDLVNNLVYLLPIALFIAVRIINVKQSGDKKKQQKESAGKLIEKVREARQNPAYAGSLTEATEVYIPPSQRLMQNSVPAQKRTGKKLKAPSPQNQYAYPPLKPDEEAAKTDPGLGSPTATLGAEPKPVQNTSGSLPGGLTPLQQALVWSEILGPPRSEQDFPFP
jgi:hypothetical protein